MNDSVIRYQYNPVLTDTVGFFDYCIPLTDESSPVVVDSVLKYYDFSLYNYITPAPPARQLLQTTSVFSPNNLAPKHTGPLAINRQNTDWITLIFVVCLIILAWIQTSNSKRLKQIFKAVAQAHSVNQLEREGNLFSERLTLGLRFIYYTVGSVFAFQLLEALDIVPSGMSNLAVTGIILGCLLLYHLTKTAIVYGSGIIFDTLESARQYQLNILIFNHVTGLFLIPVTLIAFYWKSTEVLTFGVVIISLLTLYQFLRGILTGLNNKRYNLFYLFLYLCTLEILPLLLLFKVVSRM